AARGALLARAGRHREQRRSAVPPRRRRDHRLDAADREDSLGRRTLHAVQPRRRIGALPRGDGRGAGRRGRATAARPPGKTRQPQPDGAAPRAHRAAPGVRHRHAVAAAGVLGDARHGPHRAAVAAADAIVRPPRGPVAQVLQPAARRRRVTETFQEYSARLLSYSSDKDPLAVLASTPARIGALIAGRRAQDLQWSPAPARWWVAQIVAHLSAAEVVGAYRFRMVLAQSGTPLQAFHQNAGAGGMKHGRRDARASLALFAAGRRSLLPLLDGLSDAELERYGMHAERGKESVRHLIALYAGHDLNHLGQIERLLGERDPAAGRAFTPAPPQAQIDGAQLEAVDGPGGSIRSAAPLQGADRLAVLTVSFTDRTRSIV